MTTSPSTPELGPLDIGTLTRLVNGLFRETVDPSAVAAASPAASADLPQNASSLGLPQLPISEPLFVNPTALLEVPTVPQSRSAAPQIFGAGGAHSALEQAPLYILSKAALPTHSIVPVASPWTEPIPRSLPRQAPFDIAQVRRDFPILDERINGRRLVWLDNAATTQKPRQVIDRLRHFYEHENSNIHRAAHTLAARATDAYEGARENIRAFLGAGSTTEIVLVRGATEAINLVAESWGQAHLLPDDEIVLTHLEHHANIVPWQQVAARTGAKLRVVPVDASGQVRLDEYARLLGSRTKLVSFTQVSNALGTITPAQQMTQMARAVGAKVLIDGAQAVSHMPIDVQALGCDWYVFSGHKVFAPTGIGALYGTRAILEEMPPWQGGGNMIADVTFEQTRYQAAPAKFEAGTGNIADAVGLGAALEYLGRITMAAIATYEEQLLHYATGLLEDVPGLRLIGTAQEKAGVLSFVLDGVNDLEVGKALDQEGIAVRAGHHCAQPILRRFGVESSVRASLAFYNTCADVEALASALQRIASGRSSRR